MAFTEEEKTVIKFLRQNRKYGAKRFLREFPEKGWTLGGLKYLLQKIDKTGSSQRQKGSGRTQSDATKKNIESIKALICSRQKDNPKQCLSQRAIARQLGLPQATVNKIIRTELIGPRRVSKTPRIPKPSKPRTSELTEAKRKLRLQRVKHLLKRYPVNAGSLIWFTNQKIFTVAAPPPADQGNKIKSAFANLKKKSIPEKSLLVSAGVSSIGKTKLQFIEPGVKVNGDFYRDVMLKQTLLPDIRARSTFYTFQQDNSPVRIGPKTLELLQNETPDYIHPTIWPPNSADLNPMDYKIWSIVQEKVYEVKVKGMKDLRERIKKAWEELDPGAVGAAVSEWHMRLAACVEARGGHFELNTFHANRPETQNTIQTNMCSLNAHMPIAADKTYDQCH